MHDTPMTPTRFERLQTLFEEALEQPAADRAAFLETRAPCDRELQVEVLELIGAHDRAEAGFKSPVSASALVDAVTGEDRWIGKRVGAWQVVRLVGVGGMGAVYEAVRADDQFRKRVAVKFLHQNAGSTLAINRFKVERQILANLNHPNIASLVDGGVTDDGQPFLVMEYIDGQSITRWADERRLSRRDRVALVQQVCAAVQSAHQGLVVHRDLKPGNILVTPEGQVKLLDFGIARLLTPEGDSSQPLTFAGHRSFTPDYAAPEQVRGLPVGTTADIYALGVVLFELLTGRRPFDFKGKLLGEIEEVVCKQPPPHVEVDADLDAIVQVALRKEPERRYGSADLLARDLQHYLAGQPVSARPDGFGYRLGKLVRRRKLETAAIALAVLSLVGGLVATARQARRAEAQGKRAEQVTAFLTTMLGSADPASLGRDVTVREVLDSAAVHADTLRNSPALEGEVRTIIGHTYMALGEFEAGEAQLGRAVGAYRTQAPGGDYATGIALTRQSHALEYLGRYADADSVLHLASAIFVSHPHTDPLEEATFLDHRARILQRLGKNAEARPLLQQALELTLKNAPGRDSLLAYAYVNLGNVTSELGQHQAAESLYVLGITEARRAYGNEHPELAAMLSPYATVLERVGKVPQSDSVFLEVLAMRKKLLGPEHPEYAWTMFNYADLLLLQKRYAESARWSREVLNLRGKSLPETHMAVSTSMGVLGRALGRMDSLEAGERWLRESLALREKTLPAGHWLLASSESMLGAHFTLARRYAEAEALLLPAERKLVEARGAQARVVADARVRIVELYAAWGKADEAAQWQAKIEAQQRLQ
jgi:serine/threonine-protein kinase